MNIFFDLDGTLIDSKKRLYFLFQNLVPSSNLSFSQYWSLKRNKVNHEKILTLKFNYTKSQFQDFEKLWMSQIELKEWLDFDTPIKGVNELLAGLYQKHSLYIVTARQNIPNTLSQIEKFPWSCYITKVMITEQKYKKFELIKKFTNVHSKDWFIGDTGKDIETGKILGINTAGIYSGFLNKQCLIKYKPDILLENVTKFII
jgi:phosphoglycolate phosphatase